MSLKKMCRYLTSENFQGETVRLLGDFRLTNRFVFPVSFLSLFFLSPCLGREGIGISYLLIRSVNVPRNTKYVIFIVSCSHCLCQGTLGHRTKGRMVYRIRFWTLCPLNRFFFFIVYEYLSGIWSRLYIELLGWFPDDGKITNTENGDNGT